MVSTVLAAHSSSLLFVARGWQYAAHDYFFRIHACYLQLFPVSLLLINQNICCFLCSSQGLVFEGLGPWNLMATSVIINKKNNVDRCRTLFCILTTWKKCNKTFYYFLVGLPPFNVKYNFLFFFIRVFSEERGGGVQNLLLCICMLCMGGGAGGTQP